MTRLAALEARRQALLARCETQRAELAYRIEQLQHSPARGTAANGVPAQVNDAAHRGHHPLAWVVALGGLLLLGSTRELLVILGWARVALSLATRASQVLRLVGHLRTHRAE